MLSYLSQPNHMYTSLFECRIQCQTSHRIRMNQWVFRYFRKYNTNQNKTVSLNLLVHKMSPLGLDIKITIGILAFPMQNHYLQYYVEKDKRSLFKQQWQITECRVFLKNIFCELYHWSQSLDLQILIILLAWNKWLKSRLLYVTSLNLRLSFWVCKI